MCSRYLLIDNFDSFTYNLYRYFRLAGVTVDVIRNDIDDIDLESYKAIIISPGPGSPSDSGNSMGIVKDFLGKKPIFGVCLGMQIINEIYNGETIYSTYPHHGKQYEINHNSSELFQSIPSPLKVARYHSLAIDPKPELSIDARSSDGVVMAISDRAKSVYGVQFHPESFLTEYGLRIVENFVSIVEQFYAR
jgi:anthranilate synthase/aminodeoxychorismate synthase-like glutamine amidotransferase